MKTLLGMPISQVIETVGPLFSKDQENSGILASVSMAQFLLESKNGQSELATHANNYFGMKTMLSGNSWPNSTWTGEVYEKTTTEYYNGEKHFVKAKFRKYKSVEDSIYDHSAYLLGSRNSKGYRYEGLKGCADHRKAITIIKQGGYATDPNYVDLIMKQINKYNLKRFDVSQHRKFKTSIINLKVRKGPSVNDEIVTTIPIGVYTITEIVNGWGKLKSGLGWIYLQYAKEV